MMAGIMGAALFGLWLTSAKLGWALMDRWLERRKQRPIKAPYRWVDDPKPPKGGFFISEK